MQDIHDCLEDDGILILSTPNIACLRNIIKLCIGRNVYDGWDSSFVNSKVNRSPHVHEFTISELLKLFSRNGLDVIELKTVDRPTTKMKMPLARFRDDLFFVLKKRS